MTARSSDFQVLEDDITWRKDANGTVYSADKLSRLYFYHYLPKMKPIMHGMVCQDRHTIVAITQQTIFDHWPVTRVGIEMFSREQVPPPPGVAILNVAFAYYFAISFLEICHNSCPKTPQMAIISSDFLKQMKSEEIMRKCYAFLSQQANLTQETSSIESTALFWSQIEQEAAKVAREIG